MSISHGTRVVKVRRSVYAVKIGKAVYLRAYFGRDGHAGVLNDGHLELKVTVRRAKAFRFEMSDMKTAVFLAEALGGRVVRLKLANRDVIVDERDEGEDS